MFELPPEASESEFATLLAYWRDRAPPGRLPGRQQIDVTELPPRNLSQILLFDVDRSGDRQRHRFRVAGTEFSALVGRDPTGSCFDDLGPAERTKSVIDALDRIVATKTPVFFGWSLDPAVQRIHMGQALGSTAGQRRSHGRYGAGLISADASADRICGTPHRPTNVT